MTIQLKWMLVPHFCACTGYSVIEVHRQIKEGFWLQGQHFQRTLDGEIAMNLRAYYEWVQPEPEPREWVSGNIGYLSPDELSDLVGCKPNQRTKMSAWLKENRWRFEVNSNGLPRVARAYHDRKMGIVDGPANGRFNDEPNFDAFKAPRRTRGQP